MLPKLRQIDLSGCYTNHGPQERELRTALASDLGGRAADEISLFSSGTTALIAAMQNWGLPPGSRCLVPAWTFVGSACAVVQAGLEPVLVDVDPDSWSVDPDRIEALAKAHEAQSALITSPFGASLPYDALVEVQERGLKIVIDGAASFDFVQKIAAERRALQVPIMVSLHATKLVSSMEGGLLVHSDPDAIRRTIAWSNFGIFNGEPIEQIGTNAKLSEVHAAYGQSSLSLWSETRQRLVELAETYVEAIGTNLPLTFAPNIRERLVSSSFNVTLSHRASPLEARLAAAQIESRRWWRDGVHRFPAFRSFVPGPLPVTDDLARRTIGLPFFYEMTNAQVNRVVDSLQAACATRAFEL